MSDKEQEVRLEFETVYVRDQLLKIFHQTPPMPYRLAVGPWKPTSAHGVFVVSAASLSAVLQRLQEAGFYPTSLSFPRLEVSGTDSLCVETRLQQPVDGGGIQG